MITFIITLITFLSTFFSIYHLLSSFRYRKEPIIRVGKHLKFSIIIPCYNEARILANTIAGLLKLDYDYDNLEVIFVNDGSDDNTMEVLSEQLEMREYQDEGRIYATGKIKIFQSNKYPHIYVIDKENSGKADSLNKGIKFSHNELIVTMDGDCILDKDALNVMNQVFQDEEIIASGGVIHVMQYFLLNKKSKPIIALQALDYMKGFYIYKASLSCNNALSIISGAFGVFRKDALEAVGGFRSGLGEDIDITLKLQEYAQKNNKKITYDLRAICYTECPETWTDLARQRVRWQKAFWDAMSKNRKFIIRKFFECNVCLFILLDAAFSGTMAVISFLFNFILISLRVIYGFPPLFIVLMALALVFNILCSLIAIYRWEKITVPQVEKGSKEILENGRVNLKYLFMSIITDTLCFSLLRIYYFIKGTISYSLNHKRWDKVARTSNSYIVLNQREDCENEKQLMKTMA
mgnify:CR=1 FL=1